MKCACACAFLGVISARKSARALIPAYANGGTVAESGMNVCPCKAVGKGEKASPSTTLEGGYASGTTVDQFARVKEPSAELATAAEGVAHVGASAAAQGRGGAGTVARAQSFAAAAVETASGLARLPDLLPAA